MHRAVRELPHVRDRGRRELVEAVGPAEHHRPLDPELGEGVRHALCHRRVRHAQDAAAHAGRVGERAEEVERRGCPELAARRAGEPQGGVVLGREAEPDPGLVDAAGDAGRTEVDHDAERLEDVGRATRRRRGAVPVLGDPHARARDDQRRQGRDVDGAGAVAAGPARVDDGPTRAVQRDVDGLGEPQHRAGQSRELGSRLALGPERDGEAGDLGVGRLAGEDRGHGLLGLLGR